MSGEGGSTNAQYVAAAAGGLGGAAGAWVGFSLVISGPPGWGILAAGAIVGAVVAYHNVSNDENYVTAAVSGFLVGGAAGFVVGAGGGSGAFTRLWTWSREREGSK